MLVFGTWALDVDARSLTRAGAAVHLEPQAFDLLVYLVEHRGRVVPKHELLDQVWGHTFLSEANLTTRIKEVRRAVGDDGRAQHTIRNVRGRGYQFVAEVSADALDRRPPAGPTSPADEAGASAGSGLVGRDGLVASCVDLLEAHRLVTLTGPGGVGKSTAARAVAASARGRTRTLDLSTLDPAAPVLPAAAHALDVVLDPARPADAVRSLTGLDGLLVLDGCEHLIDEVAALVEQLICAPDGRLRVLATSRERLGLSEEVVAPVRPLAPLDARTLFVDRAHAIAPDWQPEAVGLDRIDALVAALDRLPLMIEMAAARLGSMVFDELAEAIEQGAPLLKLSHRAPARRHRSITSVVAWSAGLLDEHDRRVFEGFSVFAGRVRSSDAVAILDPSEEAGVRFALASLAERSLLQSELESATSAYAMLATVRAVAAQDLAASGDADRLHRRHAEHIAAAVAEVDHRARTIDEPEARLRLDEIVAEVRAAHRWARTNDARLASAMSASLVHLAQQSLWFEPATWSQELVERDGLDAPGAHLAAAGAAAHLGALTDARQHAQAALGSPSLTEIERGTALEILTDVCLYEGELERAAVLADELRALGEQLSDPHFLVTGVVDAALVRAYGGDPASGLDVLRSAALPELSPSGAAWRAYAIGEATCLAGTEGAVDAYEEAIELASSVGNHYVVSVARSSLAAAHHRAGDHQSALAVYGEALDAFLRHGNHTHAITAVRNLPPLLLALGDVRGATILATAGAAQRTTTYGVEAQRLEAVLLEVRDQASPQDVVAWTEHGETLDADGVLRAAADLVRATSATSSSGDPQAPPKHPGVGGGAVVP